MAPMYDNMNIVRLCRRRNLAPLLPLHTSRSQGGLEHRQAIYMLEMRMKQSLLGEDAAGWLIDQPRMHRIEGR